MFTKEEIISEYTGKPFIKFNYTFNENEPIVGVLFGHYAPFTGPNGHGRLISSLKKIGAKYFLIATPDNNKPFDDEREMFSSTQRVEIINKYLESENLNGKAIAYKMQRGGAKSQIGPLVKIAAETFGMNIRPVLCFGPDREDLASEVCNKFGKIKNPNRCEYIVDYERGTSGTKVRELIRKGDIKGIMAETGYNKSIAEELVKMRNKNKKLNENIRGKVDITFPNVEEADEFKQEMENRFEDEPYVFVSSNFRLKKESIIKSFDRVLNECKFSNNNESVKKIYESSQDEEQILATSKARQEELKKKLQQLMEEYSDVADYEFGYCSSDNPYDCDEKDFALNFVDTPEAQKIKQDRWQRQYDEKERQFKENNWTSAEEVENSIKEIILKDDFEISDPTPKHPDRKMHFHNCGIAAVKDYRGKPHWEMRFERELEWTDNKGFYKIIKRPKRDAEIYYTFTDNLKSGPKERKVATYGSIPFNKNEIGELKYE